LDPIKLFIRRPIFTSMLVLALVVFGIFAWRKIGVDQLPNIDIPIVTITTVLPGADPETIEKNVTEPLEETLNTLPGLNTLTSVNVENVSVVVVRFDLERDINVAAQDVRDRVQSTLSKLPVDIRTPLIQKLDLGAAPIITLALSGPLPAEQLSRIADDVIKPTLQQINGVGAVNLFGDQKLEVRITLDPVRLRAYGLTPLDAVGAVRAQDLDWSSGRTAEEGRERIVKLKAEARSLQELRTLVVASPQGIPVRLGEIADVTAGPAEARSIARLGSKPAIGLTVTKQSGANTVQVAESVTANLDHVRSMLPAGCQLDRVSDDSRYIRSSLPWRSDNASQSCHELEKCHHPVRRGPFGSPLGSVRDRSIPQHTQPGGRLGRSVGIDRSPITGARARYCARRVDFLSGKSARRRVSRR